jgi:hypothetical protein
MVRVAVPLALLTSMNATDARARLPRVDPG